MTTITVKPSAVIHAAVAARNSMRANEARLGSVLVSDIARDRYVYVGSYARDFALAARADDLEADQLYREFEALRFII